MIRAMVVKRALAGITVALGTMSAAGEEAAEGVIARLEQGRIQAMIAVDIPALERILADTLTYTHSTGRVETKRQFLDALESGRTKYKSMRRDDVKVSVYGCAAVVTGRAQVELRSDGQDRAFAIRFTDVYVDGGGRWQMVAWESTRLPEP
jgi:hypothetical protein